MSNSGEKAAQREEALVQQLFDQDEAIQREERATIEYQQQSGRTEEAARKAGEEVDRLPPPEHEIDRGRGR